MLSNYKKVMDTLELVQKRLEILTGAKIRHRYKTAEAIKLQDNLRSRYSNIKKGWTGTDEIRKWRKKLKK